MITLKKGKGLFSMNQSKLLHRLKQIITIAACLNLIFLFVFHYELPSFLKHKLSGTKQSAQIQADSQKNTLSIQFDSDELTYSGKGNLNLTKGITVTNTDGTEVKAELFSEITEGKKKNEKIVQYIAEDSDGNTGTATRILHLKKYKKPSIQLKKDLPSIDDSELSSLTALFRDTNLVTANDGYGNDISSSLEVQYTVANQTATELTLTMQVTNLFNDTATHTVTLPLHRTKPLIVLKETSIHLDLGAAFLPISYVASATDEKGDDISVSVYTEGEIDTSTPGTYRITYKLKDASGNEADPVSLKITVS